MLDHCLKSMYYWKSVQKNVSYCKHAYGFVANPNISLRQNINKRLFDTPLDELNPGPTNSTCHILGSAGKFITQKDRHLIGYGLNFCVCTSSKLPSGTFDFARLTRDVRIKYNFAGKDTGSYIPKLYVCSKWSPPNAPPQIENGLKGFEDAVKNIAQWGRENGRPNL